MEAKRVAMLMDSRRGKATVIPEAFSAVRRESGVCIIDS